MPRQGGGGLTLGEAEGRGHRSVRCNWLAYTCIYIKFIRGIDDGVKNASARADAEKRAVMWGSGYFFFCGAINWDGGWRF